MVLDNKNCLKLIMGSLIVLRFYNKNHCHQVTLHMFLCVLFELLSEMEAGQQLVMMGLAG